MSEDTRDRCLSERQERALASVLDEIIPPSDDGRFPGAGELGLAGYIEQAQQQTPELRQVIVQGLSAIDELAGRRGSQGFASLSKQDKLEVLNQLAATEQAFLPSLIFHTYAGYYQNARVVEALGIEPRPPHPKGYEMEPSDLGLLERVRQRAKLYRDC
jgi:hypothetical protein